MDITLLQTFLDKFTAAGYTVHVYEGPQGATVSLNKIESGVYEIRYSGHGVDFPDALAKAMKSIKPSPMTGPAMEEVARAFVKRPNG